MSATVTPTAATQPIHFANPRPERAQESRWPREQIAALFNLPFADLMHQAQTTHRAHHNPNAVQRSTLLSIKTGGCPEDCGYCPQAARHHTGMESESMLPLDEVITAAKTAKAAGATRFCMGAAWRGPKKRHLDDLKAMFSGVKALGMLKNVPVVYEIWRKINGFPPEFYVRQNPAEKAKKDEKK